MGRLVLPLFLLTACTRTEERARPSAGDAGVLLARSSSGTLSAALRFRPANPKVGQLFEAELHFSDPQTGRRVEPERYTLDATMPAHGHGMTTIPKHGRTADGGYLTRGLKLHMPGEWTFEVRAQHGAQEATLVLPYLLAPGVER